MLMGLPRDAVFTPPKKDEEMFLYRPNHDAPVPGYARPLLMDEDGDEGHEFLVEDMETGDMQTQGHTAAGGSGDCWFKVIHKPAIVIRSKPDVKSDMVGRKKHGKTIHAQRVVDNKWLELHSSELVKLGVSEAWVLIDGSEMGLGDEQLLERVPS